MSAAGHRGETESNPFYCDEDEECYDDDGSNNLNQIKAKIQRSETSQVKSLDRARRILQETEDIGHKTAEELLHQGEQLDNTESKLDSIKAMSAVNQRHINGIKSVFGSLKNRFFGRSDGPVVAPKAEIQHSRLRETLDDEFGGGGSQHVSSPSGASSGGKSQIASLSSYDRRQHKAGASKLENDFSDDEDNDWDTLRDISHTPSHSKQAVMDEQLGDISASLGRLKHLGRGMNDELTKQNDQLGRLMGKTDDCDIVLAGQNDQMRKMLR